MDDQAIIGILLWTVGVGLVAIRLTTKKIAVPALVVGTILVIMAIPPLDQRQYDAYTLGLLIIPVFFARFVYMAQAEQHGPIVGLGSPAFVGVVGAVLYMMTALYVTSAPNDTFREMAASEPYGPIAVTAPNQVVHVKVAVEGLNHSWAYVQAELSRRNGGEPLLVFARRQYHDTFPRYRGSDVERYDTDHIDKRFVIHEPGDYALTFHIEGAANASWEQGEDRTATSRIRVSAVMPRGSATPYGMGALVLLAVAVALNFTVGRPAFPDYRMVLVAALVLLGWLALRTPSLQGYGLTGHQGDYRPAFDALFQDSGNATLLTDDMPIGPAGGLDADREAAERGDAEGADADRQAAERGDAEAQFNLAVAYDNGSGVAQDHAEAVRWYLMAARQGFAFAQFNLALKYQRGEGIPQDHPEEVRWLRRAAEQGDPDAQYLLAVAYEEGQGVPRDDAEAARWFRKAAEQGDADGQYALAIAYDSGLGVPEDAAEAAEWLRRAAGQGHAASQYLLGIACLEGRGVPLDLPRAHLWLTLAAAGGDEDAENSLAELRDAMTPAQLAQGQRLVEAWRSQPQGERRPP